MDTHEYWPGVGEIRLLPTLHESDLSDLNQQFLMLARDGHPSIRRPPPCALNGLSDDNLTRLARSPFALFRIGLHHGDMSAEPRPGYRSPQVSDRVELAVLAAGFCRFVAGLGRQPCALILGLADPERSALLSHSIADLQRLQCEGGLSIDANLYWSPGYWRGLIMAAREPGQYLISQSRLHGIQLLAAAAGGLIATRG